MSKGSKRRPRQTSQEEDNLRWDYAWGFIRITEAKMKKRITEIRERTGKP